MTKNLAALCVASLCWGFSFGVGAPLAALWLKDAGCSATIIGANTGIYYLSIAVLGCFIPTLMRRRGKACLLFGMLASGTTVALFPWSGGPLGWFLLRALNGAAAAMALIPTETLVNQGASTENRSRDFGFYAFSMAIGIAGGTCVGMQLYPILPRLAFVLGGAATLISFGVLLVWLNWPELPAEDNAREGSIDLAGNFLSYGVAWGQGFLEGSMVALMPVYLLATGLSQENVGWLMSSIMIGVITLQVPVAWLADRLGRTAVLMLCHAVTIAVLVTILCGVSVPLLAACLFLAGACSSAFYPLGLARLGERLPASLLARGSAWYLGINCLGSLIGPVVSGMAMDQFGRHALIASGLGAVCSVLIVWGAYSLLRRAPTPPDSLESNPQAKPRAAA